MYMEFQLEPGFPWFEVWKTNNAINQVVYLQLVVPVQYIFYVFIKIVQTQYKVRFSKFIFKKTTISTCHLTWW